MRTRRKERVMGMNMINVYYLHVGNRIMEFTKNCKKKKGGGE
jgi:hypothetical protein